MWQEDDEGRVRRERTLVKWMVARQDPELQRLAVMLHHPRPTLSSITP